MKRLLLVHWKPDEAPERLARLQRAGFTAGLVDYKVAAIDGIWSGLRFAPKRQEPRPGGRGRRSGF